MDCLLSEIDKIRGEREVDIRIKDCLLELYTRQQSIMDNMSFSADPCCNEAPTEGKPLVEVLDTVQSAPLDLGDGKDEQDETKSDI